MLKGVTFTQRSKEEAHDYRYFPEPDLPPLVIENEWIERVKKALPELPRPKALRFVKEYQLSRADADILADDGEVADYFEQAVKSRGWLAPQADRELGHRGAVRLAEQQR